MTTSPATVIVGLTGSCKIGCNCSSSIELCLDNGIYTATYYEDHFEHPLGLGTLQHTTIPKSTKEFVAGKLAQKVPAYEIKKMTRTDTSESPRSRLITMQDIINIKKSFNLDNLRSVHANDYVSCQKIAEELDSEVLYMKQQEVHDINYPKIKADEYVLIIMKRAQERVLLNQIKNEHLEILMDSTHGFSKNNFQATTLMCITELNEGFPLAVCISSTVNQDIMEIFLEKVKERASQPLHAHIFMSDDTTIFRKAWLAVMGPNSITHGLICSWHVQKAWLKRINLMSNVPRAEKNKIFQMLYVIHQESSTIDEFKENSKAFIKYLKVKKYLAFCTYMEKKYLPEHRAKLWAFCYRSGVMLHTNNFLEAMHKVLKYTHMYGKKVKRLDKCVLAYLDLIDDRVYDHIRNKIFGILDTKYAKKHKEGLELLVNIATNNEYQVQSSSKNSIFYNVKKIKDCETCQDRCRACSVCKHMFTCTCPDAVRNLCKHMHAVMHRLLINEEVDVPMLAPQEDQNVEIELLLKDLGNGDENNKEKLIKDINEQSKKIMEKANSSVSVELLKIIKTQQAKTIALLDAAQQQNIQEIPRSYSAKEIGNPNAEKQRKFFATEARKGRRTESIKKPTAEQKEEIVKTFQSFKEPQLSLYTDFTLTDDIEPECIEINIISE